ncbi:MAG: hypothetical protein KGL39_38355 [Patescibacteria group bacterium]|nr:hypothetical protein [Patescibacteria group bacterium]
MIDLQLLIARNAQRWNIAKVTGVGFGTVALRLSADAARHQYEAVTAEINVPWYVVAVIHEREASQDWNANIAQGDPWNRVSTHEPIGRGPFTSWHEAAIDALVNCAPYASRWKDWSAGGLLTLLEQYNGLGYAMHNVPSPYIWSGTDQYVSGKFTRDHFYDPNVVDKQLGCAGLLMNIARICNFDISTVMPVDQTSEAT